jgi:hypothetical protein
MLGVVSCDGSHRLARPAPAPHLVVSGTPSPSVSCATADVSVTALVFLDDRREPIEKMRREVEPDVRYANIATIEGTGASRYGNATVERGLMAAVLPRWPYLGGGRGRTAQLGRWRRIAEVLMRPHRSRFQLGTTVRVQIGEADRLPDQATSGGKPQQCEAVWSESHAGCPLHGWCATVHRPPTQSRNASPP